MIQKSKSPLGVGFRWQDDEGEWIETKLDAQLRNGKRVAYLKQSSYVGTIAIGASHYYGRIFAHKPNAVSDKDGASHGGYMGKKAPTTSDYYELLPQVERRLTKVEKDMDGRVIGKIGEMTYRHNTPDHISALAIKLFKKKFGPGWVLIDDNDCDKVLCET